jgi:hypothetical protein
MKAFPIAVATMLVVCAAVPSRAADNDPSIKQSPPPGWHGQGIVVTPESSIEKPGDAGQKAHTNTKIFKPIFRPPPHEKPGDADGKKGK